MNPLTTTTIPRTGTYGDMPFPVTLVNLPKKETRHDTAVQTMTATMTLPIMKINAIDHLDDEFASIDEGKRIYPLIKQALEQGRKVQLSVKGLELDGGSFFDEAICTFYGTYSAEFVDRQIEVVDMDHVDECSLDDMKRMRKRYYYNRPLYDKIMRNRAPELVYDEDEAFIRDDEITCEADMDFNYKLEEDQ